MISEYEKDFAAYLMKRIKYEEIELPEGFTIVGDIPYTDHKKNRGIWKDHED